MWSWSTRSTSFPISTSTSTGSSPTWQSVNPTARVIHAERPHRRGRRGVVRVVARRAIGSIDRFRLRQLRLGSAWPRTGNRSGVAMQQRVDRRIVEVARAPRAVHLRTASPLRPTGGPAPAVRRAELRIRAGQGTASVPFRRGRPSRGVPGARAAGEGRPGRELVG